MLCCTRTFSAKHLRVCPAMSMFPICLLTTWHRLNPNQFLLPFFPRLHLPQTGLHQGWLSDCLGPRVSILLYWTTYSRPESASLLTLSIPPCQFHQSSRHCRYTVETNDWYLVHFFLNKQRNYRATNKFVTKQVIVKVKVVKIENQREFILRTKTIFCISVQITFVEPEIIFLLFPNII